MNTDQDLLDLVNGLLGGYGDLRSDQYLSLLGFIRSKYGEDTMLDVNRRVERKEGKFYFPVNCVFTGNG